MPSGNPGIDRPRRPLEERFWPKVDASGDCWEWTASRSFGYGQIGAGGGTGRPLKAHRVAYELLVGPVPAGLELDHLCRNRACVNPDHLEPVTTQENLIRGHGPTGQHARATHCPAGHPYDETNTYHRPDHPEWRDCLTCLRTRARGRRERSAA